MGQRYQKSGYNDEALDKYDSDCRELLPGGVTSGRNFYLRGICITNAHASQADQVVLYDDATEGDEDGTGPAAGDRRLVLYCGPANTVTFDFSAPGIKFAVGVLAADLESPAAGTFATHSISIWGYES